MYKITKQTWNLYTGAIPQSNTDILIDSVNWSENINLYILPAKLDIKMAANHTKVHENYGLFSKSWIEELFTQFQYAKT